MNKEAKGIIAKITPHPGGQYIDYITVTYQFPDDYVFLSGELCTRIGNVTLTDGISDIVLRDASGSVSCQMQKTEEPSISSVHIIPARTLKAPIYFSYRLSPRRVDHNTRSGPYYDFRCEPNGFSASASSILFSFDPDEAITIQFDISQLSNDTKTYCGSNSDAYLACGNYMLLRKDSFSLIACTPPQFDMASFLQPLHDLYEHMSSFFQQANPYTIIFRKDPYPSRGGSASTDAFMCGYSDEYIPVLQEKYALLAHEMAHSFIAIDDDPVRQGWFNEAVADYLSLVFPYHMKLQDKQYYTETINQISRRFFDNPYSDYSIKKALKHAWEDTTYIQPLPYGRGFFILCTINRILHEYTDLDILDLLRYCGYHQGDFERILSILDSAVADQIRHVVNKIEAGGNIDIYQCRFEEGITFEKVKGTHDNWYAFSSSD